MVIEQQPRNEFTLLGIASFILINGILVLNLAAGKLDIKIWGVTAGIIFSWFMVHAIIRRRFRRGDPLIFPLAAFLTAIGLVMILRLAPNLFWAQAIWAETGLVAFAFATFFFRRLETLAQYKYINGILGIGLLLSAILFGVNIGGHKSWIILGPVHFQPSEFAKLFIVFFLAAYLDERREVLTFAGKRYGWLTLPAPRFIAPLLVVWGLTMVMFVVQRDLGSALLFFGVAVAMLYIASNRIDYVLIGLALFFAGSFLCYYLYSHIQVRIDIWLNPWSDPNGKAYQIVQSLFAFAAGGLWGSGLTYGFPTMIPEVHTDFVFAAIGEELGFIGTAAILIAYILLLYCSFRTVLRTAGSFSLLVAAGLSVIVGLQVFLIIGGVTKFFPLTGMPLPLVSYGGSSMISNYILFGILFAISEMRPLDEE
ncbi:cell cycle protein ftsw/roda [Lucifera butyrica]|uniref:Cell cycle protein ftsw/roda n=1 Tax=Lucifera butyrica TaxID=1351585 RepID=A0A498RFR9_9FIRM|nr:FtsW/RodA/SpoVE family cell cycle protein [Lucifera butyrica]VBB07938.1 cell cycle protein ftsw/roda [Lucifera butyrica]